MSYFSIYLIDNNGGLFVPSLIFSQSPILYVKMDAIDWLEICQAQIIHPCAQRDIVKNFTRLEIG